MYEQRYEFTFEAAHELASNVGGDADHPYSHVHGHSFYVTLVLRAEDVTADGWIIDFALVKAEAEAVKSVLDHRLLNEIDGLQKPTLETLARWIFSRVQTSITELYAVEVARPSLGERVAFTMD